jgi:nucleotide-binding universal stress UspA family protein
MKTILVPTDYSDTANNALHYAVELAKFSKAKIILLHVYPIPVPAGEVHIAIISPQELKKGNEARIKKLEKKIAKQVAGKIKVQSIIRSGFAVEEIMNVINEKKVDLVVMGITGTGNVSEILIGSHTVSLIKQTQTPVLVIPKDARYKDIKKIMLAYDYSKVLHEYAINKFIKFVKLFKAKVFVLNVVNHIESSTYENAAACSAIEKLLKNIKHTYNFTSAEDTIGEINAFADKHKCNCVAMIPHKHNILSRLVHESNTKKMAFHTHIPLLALHD